LHQTGWINNKAIKEVFMRFSKTLLIVLITIPFLFSCTKYRYGDRTFTDRKSAEAAQKEDIEYRFSAIKPRSSALAKYAKAVIPSKGLILERGLKPGGSAEARDYVASVLYLGFKAVPDGIRKRNIFEKLDIEDSSEAGHVTPKSGEIVIYLYMPDNKTAGWYYLSEKTKRTPLHFDTGNPDKAQRTKYFIDSVEALVSGE
jgi:hypothetical protein